MIAGLRPAVALAALIVITSSAFGAAKCPKEGASYAIKGKIASIDKDNSGKPYYSIHHPVCSGTDGKTITAYPPDAVAACAVGKQAEAKGTYSLYCPDEGDILGGVCVAMLKDATLTCK